MISWGVTESFHEVDENHVLQVKSKTFSSIIQCHMCRHKCLLGIPTLNNIFLTSAILFDIGNVSMGTTNNVLCQMCSCYNFTVVTQQTLTI